MAEQRPQLRGLLACDLDGTLLDGDGRLADGVGAAVDALRAAGMPLVVCTGRPLQAARLLVKRAGLQPLALACYHGALLVHLGSRELLAHRPLLPETLPEVLGALRRHEVDVTLYHEHDGRPVRRAVGPTMPAPAAATRLIAVGKSESVAAAERGIVALGLAAVRVDVRPPGILDVRHAEATKEAALSLLASHYGVSLHDVVACGDDETDAGMLRSAGTAIAVGAPASGRPAGLAGVACEVVEQADLGAALGALAHARRD